MSSPSVDAWDAWRPEEAARRLEGVGVPWWVVGGWAIDLWLGRETREHEDLEIAIMPRDFQAVRTHLSAYRFYSVGDGRIEPLEDHSGPVKDQNWVLDVDANRWRMDVMLEPGGDESWHCRRDEAISAPRSWIMGTSQEGIPFLMPAGVLLFKAKGVRPKDELDFATAIKAMDAPSKIWLREGLEKIHPGHAWIERLGI